ncbi:hypothetical protein QJS66_23615 (plasmid) [Kocuria rhizophila]|nr:hypothetical protein QJS66_23615 [Kocuria rhizophila]
MTILAVLLAIAAFGRPVAVFQSVSTTLSAMCQQIRIEAKRWVFLALIPAGAALWLAVREPVHALLMALEDGYDERFADIISFGNNYNPHNPYVWLMIATIPV